MAKSLASINIGLNVDLARFQTDLQKASTEMKAFGDKMQSMGTKLSLAVTAPLAGLAALSLKNFDTQAKAIAQVEQGLLSTGNAAGFTSEELQKMASELQNNSLFGDEKILKDATAQLLTFTNIAGEQFARTQQAALDLSTRLDGDLKSASIMLGKALNDPVANLSALSRAGIQFSEEQKSTIKSLVETNRLADAQTIILDELAKQYGGSAAAAAEAGLGPLKQLQNTLGDITEKFGAVIAKAIMPFVKSLQKVATQFDNLSPRTQKIIVAVGGIAAAIGPALLAIGTMAKMLSGLALVSLPVTGAFVGIAAAVGTAAYLIIKNWEPIKEYFTSGPGAEMWNTVKVTISTAFESIKTIVSAVIQFLTPLWQGFANVIIEVAKVVGGVLKNVFTGAFNIITDVFRVFHSVFTGNWDSLWKSLANIAIDFANTVSGLFMDFLGGIIGLAAKAADALGKKGLAYALYSAQENMEKFSEALKITRYELPPLETNLWKTSDAVEKVGEKAKSTTTQVGLLGRAMQMIDKMPGTDWNLDPWERGLDKLKHLSKEQLDRVKELRRIEFFERQGFDMGAARNNLMMSGLTPISMDMEEGEEMDMDAMTEKIAAAKNEAQQFADLQQQIVGLAGDMGSSFFEAGADIEKQFENLGEVVKRVIQQLVKSLILSAILAPILSPFSGAASFGAGFSQMFGQMFGRFSGFTIPGLADGGIVTRPTLAMVGEGGESEAVIPLSRLNSMMGSGPSGRLSVEGRFRLDGQTANAIIERYHYQKSR